jgi:hypothetical protein
MKPQNSITGDTEKHSFQYLENAGDSVVRRNRYGSDDKRVKRGMGIQRDTYPIQSRPSLRSLWLPVDSTLTNFRRDT